MVGPKTRYTYADLCRLPDDGTRHEVIEGDLLVTPVPLTPHQLILMRLVSALHAWVSDHDLGTCLPAPTDVVLREDTVVEPDILFVTKKRREIVQRKHVTAAPDLVVEVLSPATRRTDTVRKRALYARHGVREYWLVDPDASTIEITTLRDGGLGTVARVTEGKASSPCVLPGFSVATTVLFADLP